MSPAACPLGHWGANCAQLCQCRHGGTCHPQHGSCFCPPGRTGHLCLEGTSRRGTPCPCLQVSPSLRRGLLFPGPSDPRLPPRLSKQAALQGCSVPIVPNHASAVPERGATQRLGPVCVPQGTVAPPAGLVSSHLAPPYPHPAPHCAQGTRTQVHAQVSARWYPCITLPPYWGLSHACIPSSPVGPRHCPE